MWSKLIAAGLVGVALTQQGCAQTCAEWQTAWTEDRLTMSQAQKEQAWAGDKESCRTACADDVPLKEKCGEKDGMPIAVVTGCSDTQYETKETCEENAGTWTE